MRVLSIDRPGMGSSDPASGSPDAGRYVEDLYAALQQIDAAGPYVMLAHSMGSLTTRAFAMRYPDEVAGMVLVDPRDLDIVTFPREIAGDARPERRLCLYSSKMAQSTEKDTPSTIGP